MIAECHPEQLIVDGKYLTSSALSELISTIIQTSTNVAHTEVDKGEPLTRKLKEQVSVSNRIFFRFLTIISISEVFSFSYIRRALQVAKYYTLLLVSVTQSEKFLIFFT